MKTTITNCSENITSLEKGNIFYASEEYDKAIEEYTKAIEINPKDDKAYYNMGHAYEEKHEYDLAVEAYKRAKEINPQLDMDTPYMELFMEITGNTLN